jgi:predicted F0F1-ATPase subunit
MNDKKALFRSLGMLSSMGISVAVAIFIGVFIGLWLDKHFGTKNIFFYIFLFIGIAAGFRNIYVITRREIRREENSDDE